VDPIPATTQFLLRHYPVIGHTIRCVFTKPRHSVCPKLAGTALSADQIAALLTTGDDAKKAPHKKAISGLSADDAKDVADSVKTLK
jgi:hypothetical protein